MIGPIGAFDQNGVFGIGSHLPWGDEQGRSAIRLDMGRVVEVTRKRILADGKQNVLVMGRGTIESMGWRALPGRRTIILSQTLNEREVNANLPEGKTFAVERNASQAVSRALEYEDCGHIFFFGGEYVWLQALKSDLCNAAFITVVNCDSVPMSMHKEGEVRRLPEMLLDTTFTDMNREHIVVKDTWGDISVELEFRNYMK